MSDANKAITKRWVDEIWNGNDLSSAHEYVSETVFLQSNHIPPARGLKQLEETVLGLRSGFPDGRYTVHETVAEGDTVVQRWTFRGTHLGESFGIPATGKKVEITGTATTHLKNGKIVDHLADWDALALMQQLGVVES